MSPRLRNCSVNSDHNSVRKKCSQKAPTMSQFVRQMFCTCVFTGTIYAHAGRCQGSHPNHSCTSAAGSGFICQWGTIKLLPPPHRTFMVHGMCMYISVCVCGGWLWGGRRLTLQPLSWHLQGRVAFNSCSLATVATLLGSSFFVKCTLTPPSSHLPPPLLHPKVTSPSVISSVQIT